MSADTFPTPWTVEVITPAVGTGYDDFGNPIPGEPTTRTEPVYGWAPAGTSETRVSWQQQVQAELEVYAPPTFTVSADDEVIVDGVTYEVAGEVEDYNHGPFSFAPGVRVNLRRVSG